MISVLFEDETILVLDKPPGLIVEPAETTQKETLADILQKDFRIGLSRGGIVHRLDKDTSGVLIAAKTQEALENLQTQFKERKTKKEYMALVHGLVLENGVVDAAIIRNPGDREKFITASPKPRTFSAGDVGEVRFQDSADKSGEALESLKLRKPWTESPRKLIVSLQGDALEARQAVTEYQPIQSLKMSSELIEKIFTGFNKIQRRKLQTMNYQLYTFLAVRPKTGRTHQIRVHLKYIGYPIVADEKYVGRKMYRLDKRWCPRQFLHARKLGFYHPKTEEWMEIESPLAEDLKKALESLT